MNEKTKMIFLRVMCVPLGIIYFLIGALVVVISLLHSLVFAVFVNIADAAFYTNDNYVRVTYNKHRDQFTKFHEGMCGILNIGR